MNIIRWIEDAHRAYSEHLSDIRYLEFSNRFNSIEFDLQLETAVAYELNYLHPSIRTTLEKDIPMQNVKIQQYENRLYFTLPSGREIEITIPTVPSLMQEF